MLALTYRFDTGAIKIAFKVVALAAAIVSGVVLSAVIAQILLPVIFGALAVFLAFLCGLACAVVAMIAHAVVAAAAMTAYALLGALALKVAAMLVKVDWRKVWAVVAEWLWAFKALALAGVLVGCVLLTIVLAPVIFNALVVVGSAASVLGLMKLLI